MFKKRTVTEIAQHDLEEARLSLLEHETKAQYHEHMCEFYKASIKRLEQHTKKGEA